MRRVLQKVLREHQDPRGRNGGPKVMAELSGNAKDQGDRQQPRKGYRKFRREIRDTPNLHGKRFEPDEHWRVFEVQDAVVAHIPPVPRDEHLFAFVRVEGIVVAAQPAITEVAKQDQRREDEYG